MRVKLLYVAENQNGRNLPNINSNVCNTQQVGQHGLKEALVEGSSQDPEICCSVTELGKVSRDVCSASDMGHGCLSILGRGVK